MGSFTITGGSNTGTCDDDSNENYVFYGNFTDSSLLSVELTGGTASPFYQLRFIFWGILMDNWNGDDNISAALYGDSVFAENQTVHRSQRWETEKLCGNNGNYEDLIHFDKTYTYSIQEVSLRFDITAAGAGG